VQHVDELFNGASFGAALLLPVQFNGAIGRRRALSGEKRLLLAVLEDAISWYLKNPNPVNRQRDDVVQEARRWIEARDDRGIFAYETICDLLEINADRLRLALRAVSERRLRLRLRRGAGRSRPLIARGPRKVGLAA
jgi:hypothetical protein